MAQNPILTIQTGRGRIRVELYPESAPNAVSNLIQITRQGLLDHREIRRIAPGFVIQPSFTCYDDERLTMEVPGEFAANGFTGGAVMREGSVGMGGDGKMMRAKQNVSASQPQYGVQGGTMLSFERKKRGLSQKALAEKSGVPVRTIRNWEDKGVSHATVGNFLKVAEAMGCTLDEIVRGDYRGLE